MKIVVFGLLEGDFIYHFVSLIVLLDIPCKCRFEPICGYVFTAKYLIINGFKEVVGFMVSVIKMKFI